MLPLEWYPDWWLEHPVYLFLAGWGSGRLLLPSLVHAALLALEIASFKELVRLPGKEGRHARIAARVVFFCHGLIVLMGIGALDGHAGYFYSPVLWGLFALLFAARALRPARRRMSAQ